MCNWTWIKSYEPNGPFAVFKRKGCLYKVMGVRLGSWGTGLCRSFGSEPCFGLRAGRTGVAGSS